MGRKFRPTGPLKPTGSFSQFNVDFSEWFLPFYFTYSGLPPTSGEGGMGDSLYYPWMSPQQWHYGNLTHVQVRSILGRMKVCCFFSPASHRKSRPMWGAEEFRKWRVSRAGRESVVWPSAFSPVFTTSQLGLEQTEQLWPEVNVDGDFIKPFLETVLFFCFVLFTSEAGPPSAAFRPANALRLSEGSLEASPSLPASPTDLSVIVGTPHTWA